MSNVFLDSLKPLLVIVGLSTLSVVIMIAVIYAFKYIFVSIRMMIKDMRCKHSNPNNLFIKDDQYLCLDCCRIYHYMNPLYTYYLDNANINSLAYTVEIMSFVDFYVKFHTLQD